MEGKYVIVRCTAVGVHAGVLESLTEGAVTLTDSRHLWYWHAAEGLMALSGVAVAGLESDSRVMAAVRRIVLLDPCAILECSASAEDSIRTQPVGKASCAHT